MLYFGKRQETNVNTNLASYVGKKFYSPVYLPTDKQDSDKDTRTTLFWEPNVFINEKGEGSISFYNGDIPGGYRITLEGVSGTGTTGRIEKNYAVVAPF